MRKIALFSWTLFLLLICSCSSNQTARSETRFDLSAAGTKNYDQPPQIIGVISPVYPEFARNHRVQGSVVLEVEVDEFGNVGNITVKKSIPTLDQAAIDAVNRVRFKPALKDGKAVDSKIMIPIEFKMDIRMD